MKFLLLSLFVFSLHGMDRQLSTEFKQFESLPVHIRAKIVFHVGDDLGWQVWVEGHKRSCERALPFLQTSKRYYCNNDDFISELLKLIAAKYNKNVPFLGVAYLNIPATRLFLKKFINEPENHQKLFTGNPVDTYCFYGDKDYDCFLCMMDEIRRTRSLPSLIDSPHALARLPLWSQER